MSKVIPPVDQKNISPMWEIHAEPQDHQEKKSSTRKDNKGVHHKLNTIARGFAEGGETSLTHMRYVFQIMNIENPYNNE